MEPAVFIGVHAVTFTPEELALLAISDRAEVGTRWGKNKNSGNRTPRDLTRLGKLSFGQALALHHAGASREELARAADCFIGTVGEWRRRNGLARRKIR